MNTAAQLHLPCWSFILVHVAALIHCTQPKWSLYLTGIMNGLHSGPFLMVWCQADQPGLELTEVCMLLPQ